jgi:histidinol-phosphate aminotransferase
MEPRDLTAHGEYVAGRGVEEVARELGMEPGDLVTLSSNENPLGPSPAAVEAVREHAGRVNSYPKASHADLRERVAEEWDLATDQVWLGPGGDGALDCLHRAVLEPGDEILVPDPGFAYYAMSARYHHGEVTTYPLRKADGFAQTAEGVLESYDGERVVYVITPHSPTGTEMAPAEIERLADALEEDTLLLVDEAYGEYTDAPSAVGLMDGRDDVAVLRTFSKSYGLAGLRVGYVLAPEPWADAYAKVNTPFGVNELGCRAALAALDDDEFVRETVETARWAREYIYDTLEAPTWESAANFVLAEVGDATAVADACQREGLVIRDCTSFGLPDCVRITCGTREETRRAVATLNGVLDERPEAR